MSRCSPPRCIFTVKTLILTQVTVYLLVQILDRASVQPSVDQPTNRTDREVQRTECEDSIQHVVRRDDRVLTPHVVLDEASTKQKESHNNSNEHSQALANRLVYIPQIPDPEGISCARLFDGDSEEVKKADEIQARMRYNAFVADEKLYYKLEDCNEFSQQRMYVKETTEEEEDFPIAFSILLYKDPTQSERLLRAIYRPQNYYCLHVDKKSSYMTHQIIKRLSNCFPNVFVASRAVNVHWGWYSVVEPDVICLQDLLKYKKWKYFINLTGQEFPLKTNLEIVRILKAYNGANDIQAIRMSDLHQGIRERVKYGYPRYNDSARYVKQPFSHNITWAKGAVHIAASRAFAEFLVNSQVGRDFQDWVRDTSHGSEHLFNPLQMSPQLGVPGSYTGTLPNTYSQSHVRFKLWSDHGKVCHGFYKRTICIMSIGELPTLRASSHMFVNKFHADYQPIAYSCMEQYIFDKMREDFDGVTRINTTFYETLDFVKHHLSLK